MTTIEQILNKANYWDKVYGGWMGKNIGGTLGGPLEGQKELMDYDFYPNQFSGPMANDDLDLQLVWLHALETYGPRLTAVQLANEWQDHIFMPFDEYGYAMTNMRKGLTPPLSGWFDNPFIDCMGSPIRSEIWAMVCPGDPELAAYYANQDAITDHAGGEGVYGEMFFAAIESAGFIESNRDVLIQTGLSVIPDDCRVALAVKDTIKWHEDGFDWRETRKKILDRHGHSNFTDAPQNVAFTILGWLYGEDFGDAICKAVNCGYDTDCTGATLGAILGIIDGAKSLPEKWTDPLGDRVVVSPTVRGFPAPKTIEELTVRTERMAREMAAYWHERPRPHVSSLWGRSPRSMSFSFPEGSASEPSLEVSFLYDEQGPSVYPGHQKVVDIELVNRSTDEWRGRVYFVLPQGWSGGEAFQYDLKAGDSLRVPVVFSVSSESQAVYPVNMVVERTVNGALWTTFQRQVPFLKGVKWEIENPAGDKTTYISAAARVDFKKAFQTLPEGTYRLRTSVFVPSSRSSRLVLGTGNPVSVLVNGKEVFHSPQSVDAAASSAYHRGRGFALELQQGTHELEILLEKSADGALEFQAAFVATGDGKEPAPFFSYVDVVVG